MFLSNNINCKDCFVHIINQAPILQSSINQVNHKPWQKIIIVVILATGNEHDLVRNIDGALRRLEPDDDRSPPRDRRRSSRHHSQVSLSVSAKKLRKRKVQTCKNSTASGCLKFEMWECEIVVMNCCQKVPDNIDQWTFADSNEPGGRQSRL